MGEWTHKKTFSSNTIHQTQEVTSEGSPLPVLQKPEKTFFYFCIKSLIISDA